MEKHEAEIETLTLIPSDEGRFEVDVNGQPIFSKLSLKRHAEPGEVVGLVKKLLEK